MATAGSGAGVSVVRDRLLVVVKVIEGEFWPELKLVEDDSGSSWRIAGVGFGPAGARKTGLHALALEHVGGSGAIESGALLVAS